jgi:hypothetical protein
MGIAGTFYRVIGRRFSTTLAAAAGGVFFFDLLINKGGDAIWDSVSSLFRGVLAFLSHVDFFFFNSNLHSFFSD